MGKMRITLDPGHGGRQPGAVGFNGLLEKDVVLEVALRARRLLAEDMEVYMTRTTDITLPLRQRLPVAGNSLFVSIHANAFHLRSANGTETFFNSRNPNSKIFADIMQKNLDNHLNLRNRGVKWADFTVLTQTSIPAVLVELAFISNLEEERLMGTSAFQHSAAQGIASGILEYLEFIS